MKKALIGISDNIAKNSNKINTWAQSFKKHSDALVILIVANPSEIDLAYCNNKYIDKYVFVKIENQSINDGRLKVIADYIKESDIDLFITTDVFDVIFQGDPFLKLDLQKYDIFVGSEGINVCNEPWNADVIAKCFPQYLHEALGTEVICSGVIAGKSNELAALLYMMASHCEKAPKNHDIRDQAALICIMATRSAGFSIKVFTLDDGWAVHCAVAGPTQFFEQWGFKQNLKYGIPKIDGGSIVTAYGRKYDIVHQFNRISEWNNILIADYEL